MSLFKKPFNKDVKYKKLPSWDHFKNSDSTSEHIEIFKVDNKGKSEIDNLVDFKWGYGDYQIEFYYKNLVCFHSIKNNVFVWLYGLRDYKDEIYARKLLACFKDIGDHSSGSLQFTKSWSLEILPENLETVKRLLDDELISPLSKLAAIISYLKEFSGLSTDLVLSIAKQQVSAELIKDKKFIPFENFLRPDFIFEYPNSAYRGSRSKESHEGWDSEWKIRDNAYKLALNLASFALSEGDPDETFSEYRKTIKSNGFFVNEDPHAIFQEVLVFLSKIEDFSVFENLNRDKVLFLLNFYEHNVRSMYTEEILKLYRPVVSENIKDNEYYFDTVFSKEDDTIFKSLLTKEELKLIAEIFNNSLGNDFNSAFLYKRNVLKIIEIFLNFGENAIREVAQHFKRDVIVQYSGKDVILPVEATPEMQIFLDETMDKLYDPEYADYPISWLLELQAIR